MTSAPQLRLRHFAPLLAAAGLVVSCDTPQKRALRELAKAGIEPSGNALLQAVAAQDALRAGWLLEVGVYTEQRDPRGRTPVRIAIENGDLPIVFKLLDAHANVNATADDQVGPLAIAVERGETAVVEKLLTAGARADGPMRDGEKILPWAIRKGRLSFVRTMMKSGADPHLCDRAGNPLLHVAMESGRRDLVESLIELGADPGATNAAVETTLQLAFRHGWLDAVPKLAAAGAVVVGKTNLDQFATGLVGVRSPYGACRNAVDPDYVSGGSSSGSAVAVALGLASFSLGTDTAGSGRVPAGFNNLIGLKPSLGRIPTTGVVPACRTLDAVSVFALTAADAARVLAVAQGPDAQDAYSRAMPPHGFDFGSASAFRFGVPRPDDLEFHGNAEGPAQYAQAVARLRELGGTAVEVDLRPFRAVATLLYEGPWVAERYAAIRPFIEAHPAALHPVTLAITKKGASISAPDTFAALYRLKALQQQTLPVWDGIDCLVVPTSGSPYRISDVLADPIRLNSNLGHYTNFVNLLDLSALAVPTGFLANGMPCGITLIATCGKDLPLLNLGAKLHAASVATVGATPHAPHRAARASPDSTSLDAAAIRSAFPSGLVRVAVCGAHLSGLPLNGQLTQRAARLVRSTRSAACYRLVALPGGPPAILSPWSKKISEQGPQGPVSPIIQKLSFTLPWTIWTAGLQPLETNRAAQMS